MNYLIPSERNFRLHFLHNSLSQLFMKKQKILLLISLFLLAGFSYSFDARAQKKLSYGVKAGLNLSTSTFTPYAYSENNPKAGFQAGITGEYQLQGGIYVQSELMFTTKGVVYKGEEIWIGSANPPTTQYKNTIDQLYVQVPIKLAYKLSLKPGMRLFVNGGYYAAYGAGGNDKLKSQYIGIDKPEETQTRKTFEYSVINRFDHGISTGFGIEYWDWTVGVNYESGLRNLQYKYMAGPDIHSYKNRNVSFTIGYQL
ncbi:hypothetical protein C0V77_07770 [Emticicia sp. TH156]|nr:hypothetical protein C0V77_07770 [Emticicia sp. TH156]